MSNKSALKAVRTALDSKDFEDAAEKAKDIVKQEPQNYHAYVTLRSTLFLFFLCCLVIANFVLRNVFLGLAQDKLNKNSDSEKAYLAATRAKENDRTAWQGLISLYEKQGGHKLDEYRDAALKLGQIFAEEYVPMFCIRSSSHG